MSPTERIKQYFDFRINLATVLIVAGAFFTFLTGYTRLQDQVTAMRQEFVDHKVLQSAEAQLYVRKDVQDTRNQFIDRQLQEIKVTLGEILRELKRVR